MEELVQRAIQDITYRSSKFPEEPFRIISENNNLAVPYLIDAIEKAISERDDLDENYQLHFYALYLLGQFHDRECFPKIMELISLPGDTLDYLIGDAITSGLPDILYNTYNGDLDILKKTVNNPDIDDFARGGVLKVMGQLYLDGNLEKEDWQDFIRKIVYDKTEIGDYIYTELVYIICECHFVDMLPEIRRLFEDNRPDESSLGDYESCVDMMFEHKKNICVTPINASDMLRNWAMFEDSAEKEFSEKELEKIFKAAEDDRTLHNPAKKIGRNDPCPCGSGKKYKKCCLNKPKTPVELIETEQEKQKWLRYYPVSAKVREEGRIYLEDFFDSESIEIDKLVYLALKYRPHPIWSPEPEAVAEKRKRVYLSEAFSEFKEKTEKENIRTFREYDEKYSIHYRCGEWFDVLLTLLKKAGEDNAYKEVSACCRKMK